MESPDLTRRSRPGSDRVRPRGRHDRLPRHGRDEGPRDPPQYDVQQYRDQGQRLHRLAWRGLSGRVDLASPNLLETLEDCADADADYAWSHPMHSIAWWPSLGVLLLASV